MPPKPRSNTSITKRKREPSPVKTATPRAYTRAPDVELCTEPSVPDTATVDCLDVSAPDTAGGKAVTSRCGDSSVRNEFLQDHQLPKDTHTARAMRSFGPQTNWSNSLAAYLQKKKWREKEKSLKAQNERLRLTVDRYKKELDRLKDECHVSKFLQVVEDSKLPSTKAKLILGQVINYKAKKPTWSETKAYEHIRTEKLLALPCRATLQKYLGNSVGEVGFSDLVKARLSTELECLTSSQSKHCSLVVDEMRIRQKLQCNKQRDAFLGDVDLGADLNHLLPTSEKSQLANSLLCFLLCGQRGRFKIPVGYFFTKGCSGELLAKAIKLIIKKTEEVGYRILRLVTDNHKINVVEMEILSQGQLQTQISHPTDASRQLFLAFDQSHIIKNVRSQFLSKEIGGNKEISSVYLKDLYKMQQGSTVKPVRFLTRKHIFPTNIEKMGVRTTVQVLSPPVTAALRYMKDQAGHTCHLKFANVGPTVEFMSNMYRWFVLMDVSNCQQHIHQNNPDAKEFYDPEDVRLHWLELIFLEYVEDLKEASSQENLLSKETYHALVFTTVSNIQCIRFLLNECNFQFVLTRKFSSDPIEFFFGFLRRTAGCNDIMDVRSALCGVEKMLKTGIVAASQKSNPTEVTVHICLEVAVCKLPDRTLALVGVIWKVAAAGDIICRTSTASWQRFASGGAPMSRGTEDHRDSSYLHGASVTTESGTRLQPGSWWPHFLTLSKRNMRRKAQLSLMPGGASLF
ncbi:hypothetical protein HPB50_022975 [Hyalomma asiaticum]|uniref:Uncharacterized protein n=1 Tax=Hyalomma asiaticum TaxID=266040 RepID=A0ACB7TLR9_HYAAI|nr:hypothetical protein HPB50_022975 [Hyalomma asiaticum]